MESPKFSKKIHGIKWGLPSLKRVDRKIVQSADANNSIVISSGSGTFAFSLTHTHMYTATHCNTLQHTATHYNTLQHTDVNTSLLVPKASCI